MSWPTAPLGELCEVISGGTPKRIVDEYWNGEIPWVKISDMLQGNIKYTEESITEKGLRESPARLLESGTLLLSIFATVGRTAVLSLPAATNQAIVGLKIKNNSLDQGYLRHFLDSQTTALKSKSRGVAQENINTTILKSVQIPLPPLEEQRRIAAILDRVSFLLMRSDNACTLVDKLQESIFIHSFGEFGEAAARYPTLKLEDVCSLITDGEHQTPLRSDSGVKLLSARNIRNGKLDFSDVDFVPMEEFARIGRRCAPVRGDVLISCSGSIGRVAVVDTDEPLAMVRSAAMARPIQAKVRPFYLEILLRSRHLQQCMQKSANASSQANLFQGKIRALPVFLPSLEEQDAFVARASKARASAHILASRVIELQALMQSAQNAAFSGGIQQ